ncbi:MAG: hypothetical protein M1823_003249 [Watsoniomyces obsoletus]|nr:MAG: hypothetical protein M1823_003249 [Watsoniomyces obsoletus]
MDPHEDESDHNPPASPASTIPDPDVEQETSRPSSQRRERTRADPRTSLQHVLGRDASSPPAESDATPPVSSRRERNEPPSRRRPVTTPDQANMQPPAPTTNWAWPGGYPSQRAPAAVATASSSVFSASKMKIIKKKDGDPLWRKDIQHDFLRFIFEDATPVFTNYYDGQSNCTFADIYVDAMARSNKTSKVLHDKLRSDRPAAVNMAMVCLLVNVGRMNTTLNFFPEMRAQLRTYHAIPSLQVHQDSNAYKQLQDAPRLKSILKGACEDQQELAKFENLKQLPKPRANPVSLIFMLAQYAPKLTEMHFTRNVDFFDLFTQMTLSSRSRANAFLWLMWWYLESDFTVQDSKRNPFGAGRGPDVDGVPQKLPAPRVLTALEAIGENLDTFEEVEFGNAKKEDRRKIIEQEIPVAPSTARRGRKGTNSMGLSDDGVNSPTHNTFSLPPKAILVRAAPRPRVRKRTMAPAPTAEDSNVVVHVPSDSDRTQSASPEAETPVVEHQQPEPASSTRRTKPRYRPERVERPLIPARPASLDQVSEGHYQHQEHHHNSSPAPSLPGGPSFEQYHTPLSQSAIPHAHSHSRRSRPLTAHQLALNQNRKDRVSHILRQRRLEYYKKSAKKRDREGSFLRFYRRHDAMTDPFENSEEEPIHLNINNNNNNHNNKMNGPFRDRGMGGLVPLEDEEDDYGEEAAAYVVAIRRTVRRLKRWDEEKEERKKEEEEKGMMKKSGVGRSGRRKSAAVGGNGKEVIGGGAGRRGSQNGVGSGSGNAGVIGKLDNGKGNTTKSDNNKGKGKGKERGVNGTGTGIGRKEDTRMDQFSHLDHVGEEEVDANVDEGEDEDGEDTDEEGELDDMDRELLGLADDDSEEDEHEHERGHGNGNGNGNGNGQEGSSRDGNTKGKQNGSGDRIVVGKWVIFDGDSPEEDSDGDEMDID